MGRNQLIALAVATVVCVLLVMAPRTPEEDSVQQVSTVESKIAQAAALVNGSAPMEGIMKLREIAEEYPENADVQWQLGQFSIQSGQYDKAMDRLMRVVELDASGFPDAYFLMGGIHAMNDSIESAIANFEQYKTLVKESDELEGVERMLKELKQRKQEQNALR